LVAAGGGCVCPREGVHSHARLSQVTPNTSRCKHLADQWKRRRHGAAMRSRRQTHKVEPTSEDYTLADGPYVVPECVSPKRVSREDSERAGSVFKGDGVGSRNTTNGTNVQVLLIPVATEKGSTTAREVDGQPRPSRRAMHTVNTSERAASSGACEQHHRRVRHASEGRGREVSEEHRRTRYSLGAKCQPRCHAMRALQVFLGNRAQLTAQCKCPHKR